MGPPSSTSFSYSNSVPPGRTPNPYVSGGRTPAHMGGKTPAWGMDSSRTPWGASAKTPDPSMMGRTPHHDSSGGKTPGWGAGRTPNPYADGGKTPQWNASAPTPNPYTTNSYGGATPKPTNDFGDQSGGRSTWGGATPGHPSTWGDSNTWVRCFYCYRTAYSRRNRRIRWEHRRQHGQRLHPQLVRLHRAHSGQPLRLEFTTTSERLAISSVVVISCPPHRAQYLTMKLMVCVLFMSMILVVLTASTLAEKWLLDPKLSNKPGMLCEITNSFPSRTGTDKGWLEGDHEGEKVLVLSVFNSGNERFSSRARIRFFDKPGPNPVPEIPVQLLRPIHPTKTTKIGQEVVMISGNYQGQNAKIRNVEPSGIIVVSLDGTMLLIEAKAEDAVIVEHVDDS